MDTHPPTSPDVQDIPAPSRTKRIVFICIWVVVFYFATGAVIGLASGLFFFGRGTPSEQTISWIALTWSLGPWVGAFIGLMLGLTGRLPGTRSHTRRISP